jgi:hypothetical protein
LGVCDFVPLFSLRGDGDEERDGEKERLEKEE